MCTSLHQYAREHLSGLSVELICEYLHGTVIPKMVKETSGVEKSVNELLDTEEAKKILMQYGLTCIDPSTVYQWMQKLGIKYEPRWKGYPKNSGYYYEQGDSMVELHVDSCHIFEGKAKKRLNLEVGWVSEKQGKRNHSSCLDMMSVYSKNFIQQTNHGKRLMARQSSFPKMMGKESW